MSSTLLRLQADLSRAERHLDDLYANIDLHRHLVARRQDDSIEATDNRKAWKRAGGSRPREDHYNIIPDAKEKCARKHAEVIRAEQKLSDLAEMAMRAEAEVNRLMQSIDVIHRRRREEREVEERAAAETRRERNIRADEPRGHAECSSYSSSRNRGEPSRSRSHRYGERPQPQEREGPRYYSSSRPDHYVGPPPTPRPRYEERRPTTANDQPSSPRPRYEERKPPTVSDRPYVSSSSSSSARPRYEERRPPAAAEFSTSSAQPPRPRARPPTDHNSSSSSSSYPPPPPPRPSYQERKPTSTPPAPSPPAPLSPDDEIPLATYHSWKSFTDSCFENYASITRFPFVPGIVPSCPSCPVSNENERMNKVCDCVIRKAFLAVGSGVNPKKERVRWHPDRFPRVADEELKKEIQAAGQEVFIVLGDMM